MPHIETHDVSTLFVSRAGPSKLGGEQKLGPGWSLSLPRHALTEDFVDSAQVTEARRFEPIQDLIIDSERDLSLEGTMVLADHRVGPIIGRQLGRIRVTVERAISLPPVSLPCFFAELQPFNGIGRCRCFLHSRSRTESAFGS